VPSSDFLTFFKAARVVFDRDFVNAISEPNRLCSNFRAEVKPPARQVHLPQELSGEELVAGGLVGQVNAIQEITEQGDGLSAQPEAEIGELVLLHSGVTEVSGAVHDGGFA